MSKNNEYLAASLLPTSLTPCDHFHRFYKQYTQLLFLSVSVRKHMLTKKEKDR